MLDRCPDNHGAIELGTSSDRTDASLYLRRSIEYGWDAFQGCAYSAIPAIRRVGPAPSKRLVFVQAWARADGNVGWLDPDAANERLLRTGAQFW